MAHESIVFILGPSEDKYVLCQDCIVQYAEITRSMPASDILATSRHASGDTSGSSSSSSSASFISLTRNPKSETSPLFASNPMTPDLVINDELNIREKPNGTYKLFVPKFIRCIR